MTRTSKKKQPKTPPPQSVTAIGAMLHLFRTMDPAWIGADVEVNAGCVSSPMRSISFKVDQYGNRKVILSDTNC